MLNEQEKQEMLADARSAERKKSFRRMNPADSANTLDTYLKFLNSIHKVFAKLTPTAEKPATPKFKL